MANTFGSVLRVTSFGESHGPAIGAIIDGMPAGVRIDLEQMQAQLRRRRPGQTRIMSQRKEQDNAEILSGIFEGYSTGAPIAILIPNVDQRSKDYSHIKDQFRPSHADYTYHAKYGIRDYRGGGRSSARETAVRVAAGSLAMQMIRQCCDMEIFAYVSQVGDLSIADSYLNSDPSEIEKNDVRCPDQQMARKMFDLIDKVRKDKDTIGGVITGVARNVPVGLGEPVYNKLHADLGSAMLSINAVKGFEYGSGFAGVKLLGSHHNDPFVTRDGKVNTTSNHSGGIQGGVSNGATIYFKVAFKPVATLMKEQTSIDKHGNTVKVQGKGRHDPCVVPRAVPIVEAMTSLVMADFVLLSCSDRLAKVRSLVPGGLEKTSRDPIPPGGP